MILAYRPQWDAPGESVPSEMRERQELTLQLGSEFLKRVRTSKARVRPLGVAQGWSPASYAHSVKALQKIGFDYIALGGMVPLKSNEILACLEKIAECARHQGEVPPAWRHSNRAHP